MKIIGGLCEGQVLQRLDRRGGRGATARVSGECAEAGTVYATLSLSGKAKAKSGAVAKWRRRAVGKAAKGVFAAELSGIPTGGPYRLDLECGSAKTHVKGFYVGDVWVLAGQSNMQGIGDMSGAAKPHPLVRAFSMRRQWRLATDPLHIIEESPDASHTAWQCSPQEGESLRKTAIKGVGVGVFFGREMFDATGVPQGLICTAHGGTSMQQWDPQKKNLGGASLYGSMLLSVRATGQPVAGMLWYQGESDATDADAPLYTARMKKLVAASRRDLRQPELPWMIVQIASVFGREDLECSAWSSIQEQQRLLPGKIRNLETIAAVDLSFDDAIHISSQSFPRLASRLAGAARRLALRDKRAIPFPQLRKIAYLPNSQIEVTFDHVEGDLQAPGEPRGFCLVDKENKAAPLIYKTTLHGNTVRLHAMRDPQRVLKTRLCYGYGFSPVCNITDGRGYSLPVFGPAPLREESAILPFITTWNTTGVVCPAKSLASITAAEINALPATVKSYGEDGFINDHDLWKSRSGQAYFTAFLELGEPMKLEMLMGYDGPFRVWLNDKPFAKNLKGATPAFPDETAKPVSLRAGRHKVTVGMDLNNGLAWGFFLRFRRRDVSARQIREKSYAEPCYSV